MGRWDCVTGSDDDTLDIVYLWTVDVGIAWKLSIDGKGAFDTRLTSFIGLRDMGTDGVSGLHLATAQHITSG